MCTNARSSCMCLHVWFRVLQWAVYVWYWVELRTAALGIQCYCCRSTLRQSSGKSRWAFRVEKIMTSLQSRPDISWTRTLSHSLIFCAPVYPWLCYLTIAPTVPLLTFLTSSFLSDALIQQYVKQTKKRPNKCGAWNVMVMCRISKASKRILKKETAFMFNF